MISSGCRGVGVTVGVAVAVGRGVGLGVGVRVGTSVGTGVAVAVGGGGTVAVRVAVGTGVPVGGRAVGGALHDASTSHATTPSPRAAADNPRPDPLRDDGDTVASSPKRSDRYCATTQRRCQSIRGLARPPGLNVPAEKRSLWAVFRYNKGKIA